MIFGKQSKYKKNVSELLYLLRIDVRRDLIFYINTRTFKSCSSVDQLFFNVLKAGYLIFIC